MSVRVCESPAEWCGLSAGKFFGSSLRPRLEQLHRSRLQFLSLSVPKFVSDRPLGSERAESIDIGWVNFTTQVIGL